MNIQKLLKQKESDNIATAIEELNRALYEGHLLYLREQQGSSASHERHQEEIPE